VADTIHRSSGLLALQPQPWLPGDAVSQAGIWPALAIGAAAVLAYQFTLVTFLDYLSVDTPLAYLPLLPLVAIWASWEVAGRYRGSAPPIRDRQLDYILGLPLLLIALFLITVTPVMWGTFYWSLRPDVLSFALFVTAAVVIGYGVGWAWRMRVPLLLLLLMWPALYIGALSGVLAWFVATTDSVLGLITAHFPLGVTQVAGSPSLLTVHSATGPAFQVSISSACAGGDGVLGFLLIGGALLTAVRGPIRRRLLWLTAGLVLTFGLNVARILAIVVLAAAGHPAFALGAFHEVIGLVLFGAGVAIMLWLLPAFGLSRPMRAQRPQPRGPAFGAPTPIEAFRPAGAGISRRRVVQLAAVLVGVGLFVAADQSLATYTTFTTGIGAPTVDAMTVSTPVPRGWHVSLLATYPWGTEYFGSGSSYVRYQLVDSGAAGSTVLWADVVTTPDDSTLQTYSLENCFLFHNYDIVSAKTMALGKGVTALLLNYSDTSPKGRWATLSWTWPVVLAGASSYERVELTADLVPGFHKVPNLQPSAGPVQNIVLAVENFFGSGPGSSQSPTMKPYRGADTALESFAVDFVQTSVGPTESRA
jgi:exosortase/archaeosortase family protein